MGLGAGKRSDRDVNLVAINLDTIFRSEHSMSHQESSEEIMKSNKG